MGELKTEYHFFTLPQWEQEQDYLRQMHRMGWKFVDVTFYGRYRFVRCRPEDVVYQLDYNPEAMSWSKGEYIQLFADCGWEYLQDMMGYSYFRKSVAVMKGEEGIFCDEESRFEMLKRVFRGRIIPLVMLFLVTILPQLLRASWDHSPEGKAFFYIFLTLGVLYLANFVWFGYHFWKYWRRRK